MTARELTDLEREAQHAAHTLEGAPAEDIMRWAADTFGSAFAVTCSMHDAILVDLAARVAPGLDVLFLDTGYHFAETIGTRDAVAASYDVNLITLTPDLTVPQQDARFGARLHDRDPDSCCRMRKVEPLERALRNYDAWATGLRRVDSPLRADTPVVAFDSRRGKVKVNPLAAWSDDDLHAYVAEHNVLTHPLLQAGYPSIGCAPCTRAVAWDEDPRAGRWAGSAKTECGLHT